MSVFDNLGRYLMQRSTVATNGCWIWGGQKDKDGYGRFRRIATDSWNKAYRVSYQVFHGPIPEGLCVLHKCNVKPCINPAHLYAGTPMQNVHDSMAAGTHRNGSKKKTHCKRGHELTKENRLGTRGMDCKICHAIRQRHYRMEACHSLAT